MRLNARLDKVRTQFTTKGTDPTVVVRWTVTDPETGEWIRTEEFQAVYQGRIGNARMERDLNPMQARLIHEGLEAEHSLNEMREEER